MKLKKLLGLSPKPKRSSKPRNNGIMDKQLSPNLLVRNRYRLMERLGEGGFGEVWLATDTMTQMKVALKFFHAVDDTTSDEFIKEFTLLGGQSHRNLLSPQYIDKWGKRPFIVMKYCSGGTASSLCGNISEYELWKIIHDVASGLSFLQRLDTPIVHQDLKPSNILIDEAGNYLLSDFGISKKIETVLTKMSQRAIGCGCIPYMGPERFGDDPIPILASDIWSLGATIYEFATGDLPFGIHGGVIQIAGVEVPYLNENWSTDLNDLMRKCMSMDPWDRPKASEIAVIASVHLNIGKRPETIHRIQTQSVNSSVSQAARQTTNLMAQKSERNAKDDTVKGYVDLGLSVKWADCFYGANDKYNLGQDFYPESYELKQVVATNNIPTLTQIRELIEKCEWQPQKLGRTIVGFNVVGPNGNSIYIPFIKVQTNEDKVSRSEWYAMKKVLYFPAKEEFDDYMIIGKCKIDKNGATITTSIVSDKLHIRLVCY